MNWKQRIASWFGCQYIFSNGGGNHWVVKRVHIIQGLPYLATAKHQDSATGKSGIAYSPLDPEELNTKWRPFTKRVAALAVMMADAIPHGSDSENQCAPESPDQRYMSFSPDDCEMDRTIDRILSRNPGSPYDHRG